MGRLVEAMLAQDSQLGDQLAGSESVLEKALESFIAAGAAAWPTVHVAPERLAGFVAERLAATSEGLFALGDLPAADLYLACACADGDRAAIAAFEGRYLGEVDAAARAMRAPDEVAD